MASSYWLSAGLLFLLSLMAPAMAKQYHLVETWQGKNFLDYFNFYTGTDPTNGFVTYLDQNSAERAGLVKLTDAGSVYLGVDHHTTLSSNGKGRDSVRIGSKMYYDKSLVIADIAHMPGSICGTWPAFWSVGKQWPGDGEIDIIEGVNLQDHNEIVMHTAGTCSLTDTGMTGAVNATGCGESLGTVGCVIEGDRGSYGTSFNRQGGGVYAMEWTEQFLKIWFFPRHSIPASIAKGNPDVSQFGTPMALVEEGCDVANSFKEQSFVFDVTFCGDWAGGVFGESGCPMSGSDPFQSCVAYVAQNPSQFEQSYWEINSVKIYQTGSEDIPVPSTSQSSATAAVSESSVAENHVTQAAQTVASVASSSIGNAAPAGIVAQTPDESVPSALTSATSTVVESSTIRYVTKFVTDTTTVCAEAKTLSAASGKAPVPNSQPAESSTSSNTFASVQIEPPAAWHTVQQEASTAGQQSSTQMQPASVTIATPSVEPANSQKSNSDSSADAVSSNGPSESTSPTVENGLPSIIPAPGVVLGSAGLLPSIHGTQSSKPVNPTPTRSAVLSGNIFPEGSSTAAVPVFTGAADKVMAKLPVIAVVFGLAMIA